jgi:hypothetical protein
LPEAIATLDHARQQRVQQHRLGEEVHLEDRTEMREVRFRELGPWRHRRAAAGIVHQQVDPAMRGGGFIDEAPDEVGLHHAADMGCHRHAMGAERLGGVRQARLVDIVEREGAAALRQFGRRGGADPTTGAGDDRDLAREAAHAGFLARGSENIGLAALLVQIWWRVKRHWPVALLKLNR